LGAEGRRACGQGLAEIVERLLDLDANPALTDRDGNTPLILAIVHGHAAAAEKLLSQKSQLAALDVQSAAGLRSAIMRASEKGMKAIVEKLLGMGAKVGLKDKYGKIALILALENTHEAVAEILLPQTAQAGALDVQGTGHLDRKSARYGRAAAAQRRADSATFRGGVTDRLRTRPFSGGAREVCAAPQAPPRGARAPGGSPGPPPRGPGPGTGPPPAPGPGPPPAAPQAPAGARAPSRRSPGPRPGPGPGPLPPLPRPPPGPSGGVPRPASARGGGAKTRRFGGLSH
jgi:hypothetical protein